MTTAPAYVRCDRCGTYGRALDAHACPTRTLPLVADRPSGPTSVYVPAAPVNENRPPADIAFAVTFETRDGETVRRLRPEASPSLVESRPKHPLLTLLRDLACVARWDAHGAAPSTHPTQRAGGAVGARPAATDRPDWVDDRAAALDRGRQLRQRLNGLAAAGRATTAADARVFEVVWVLACCVLHDAYADEPLPVPVPQRPPPRVCDAERAAAVLEYLVPRARVLLDSAGSQGVPVGRSLPRLLAEEFTAAPRWRAWHPSPPPPPLDPDRREPPAAPPPFRGPPEPTPPDALPPAAGPWQREHHARLVAAHAAERRDHERTWGVHVAAHVVAVLAWARTLVDYDCRHARHADALARYAEAKRVHARDVAAGDAAASRTGSDLVRLAHAAWFGQPPSDEE
jgi:hypothetical protein